MGGSYGGYATLAALAFSPGEFSCGVDIVGPSNLNTLLATIPPYWSTMVAAFHKRMGDNEEFLNSQSPLFKAHEIKAPLLIGQGANDPRVKQAESDQIAAAIRANGQPVEYYVFPDEGHGFHGRRMTWPSMQRWSASWRSIWAVAPSLRRRKKTSCWSASNNEVWQGDGSSA